MVEAVDNAASIEEGELQHGAEAELGPLRVGWLVCRLEELLPAERFVGGHAHPLVHGPAGGDPGRAVPLVHLAVRTGQPERPRAQHARPGDIGSEHKARRLSLQRALQVRLDDVEAGVVALAVLDLDRQTLSAHSRCTRMNSCLSGFRVCSVTGIFATASAWVGSSLKLASSSSSGSTGVTTRSSGSVVRAMGSLHREAEGRAVEEPRVTRPEPAIAATSVDDGGVDVAALDREGRATRAVGLDEPPAAIHGARQLLVALDPVAGRRFVSNGLPPTQIRHCSLPRSEGCSPAVAGCRSRRRKLGIARGSGSAEAGSASASFPQASQPGRGGPRRNSSILGSVGKYDSMSAKAASGFAEWVVAATVIRLDECVPGAGAGTLPFTPTSRISWTLRNQ